MFCAIGSIYQEAQDVKFNCSCTSGSKDCSCLLEILGLIVGCTSGLPRQKISSTIFQVQLLALLPDYSGYNIFLPIIRFNVFIEDKFQALRILASISTFLIYQVQYFGLSLIRLIFLALHQKLSLTF
jgi:hypothetical protein